MAEIHKLGDNTKTHPRASISKLLNTATCTDHNTKQKRHTPATMADNQVPWRNGAGTARSVPPPPAPPAPPAPPPGANNERREDPAACFTTNAFHGLPDPRLKEWYAAHNMDYDAIMEDTEALGPGVKISHVSAYILSYAAQQLSPRLAAPSLSVVIF